MKLTGQTVAVLGAGRSGRAAAELALRLGAKVSLYDSRGNEAFEGINEEITCVPNATVETGESVVVDLIVISPGIETEGDFVQSFAKGSGELIGEVELASRVYKGKIVGITGTNGKTTTTELIERVLQAGGISCVAAGNYGVPLAEVVMSNDVPESVALELSSFQLETIAQLRPQVAVWLNFSPDHMDRYQSVQEYHAAKLRIFENQSRQDHAVVRHGEELGELSASTVTFSATEEGADFTLRSRKIYRCGELVGDLERTRMRGIHNAENLMAALAAGEAMGVPCKVAMAALETYSSPAHRCELVGEHRGVEYINDSKATNLHALESALLSQTQTTILIAGGKEKGLDYRSLLPLLEEKVERAILIGEIRNSLNELIKEVVATEMADSLEEAVESAASRAGEGTTVLFSPGTSSFDMFSGYEARGEAFRAAVHQLK